MADITVRRIRFSFEEPIDFEVSDERLMRRQRAAVDELARRHVGTPLMGGQLDDLRVIQELLDQRVVPSEEIF